MRKNQAFIWLSNGLFLLTGLMILAVGLLFVNPALVPGPLRPPTDFPTPTVMVTLAPVTPSPTDLVLEPNTATPTPSATIPPSTATPTFTSTPENTPTPTFTPTLAFTPLPTVTATETPTPTLTATITPSAFRYTLQEAYPRYAPYPGGCQWLGFSGQVFDLNGKPVIDVVVRIGGVDYLTLSGASQEYSILGWAQKVADQPANTQGYYSVQLQDTLGNPLSAPVALTTTANCSQNLVSINFVQNH